MRRLAPVVCAACLVLVTALGSVAAALEVPFLSGRVVDAAGMIPVDVRERIERELAGLEDTTGAQVAVLTIPGLEGEILEEFSMRVVETWKLGRADHDDGVLFLVARDDRRMRLEVGYGLEAVLTDALCRQILDTVVQPRFRRGDFGEGVEEGVRAITGTLLGEDVIADLAASEGATSMPWFPRMMAMLLFVVVVGTFSMLALFPKGGQSWVLYAFLMPFYLAFPAAFLHPRAGIVAFLVWAIGFPIGRLILARTPSGKAFRARHPGFTTWTSSSSRSGGGWSSGGFSGGGGSFGGGGASSGW